MTGRRARRRARHGTARAPRCAPPQRAGHDPHGVTPDDYLVVVLDGAYGIGEVHGPYSGLDATVAADALQRRLAARGFGDLEVRVARLHR
jgi:hypothetical protein